MQQHIAATEAEDGSRAHHLSFVLPSFGLSDVCATHPNRSMRSSRSFIMIRRRRAKATANLSRARQ
jgi:hypothetical protein